MSVTIESTTDSAEDVIAATGNLSTKAEEVETQIAAPDDESSETKSESAPEETEDDDALDESLKEEDDKPKKKGGFKRRIDKLTSKVSLANKEAKYWREQALRTQAPEPKESVAEEATTETMDDRPDPDTFDTHREYLEALTDWKLEKRFTEQKTKEKEQSLKSEMQTQIQSHQKRVDAFAKAHDDFAEVISDIDDIPMSLTVQEVILSSENGPELMYELAQNREEYARICGLSAISAARELGKIEARLLKTETKNIETKTTKAPPPIKPVGSKSSNTSTKAPDEMSYQDYKRWREKQL